MGPRRGPPPLITLGRCALFLPSCNLLFDLDSRYSRSVESTSRANYGGLLYVFERDVKIIRDVSEIRKGFSRAGNFVGCVRLIYDGVQADGRVACERRKWSDK